MPPRPLPDQQLVLEISEQLETAASELLARWSETSAAPGIRAEAIIRYLNSSEGKRLSDRLLAIPGPENWSGGPPLPTLSDQRRVFKSLADRVADALGVSVTKSAARSFGQIVEAARCESVTKALRSDPFSDPARTFASRLFVGLCSPRPDIARLPFAEGVAKAVESYGPWIGDQLAVTAAERLPAGGAWAEAVAKAGKLRTSDPELSQAAAIDRVLDQDIALSQRVLAEEQGR